MNGDNDTQAPRRKSVLGGAVGSRQFRLLWIGQGTSLLGDQFSFIALPWLVLQLTPDPAALGLVLALAGIPRAVFMLLGGAAADRFSPRAVMIASDVVRFLLTVVMAVLVATGGMSLWLLYIFVLLFGTFSGLFLPASSSIIPRIVSSESLQPANALFQGTAQITVFVGPVLAGGLIAFIGNRLLGAAVPAAGSGDSATGGLLGIAVALLFDSLTFLVSIATLWAMGRSPSAAAADGTAQPTASGEGAASSAHPAAGVQGVVTSIAEGFRYVARDPFLSGILIIVAAINFMFVGPLFVGIPYLAKTRFAEGAAAFGLIMSGYGGGNLAGYALAGALQKVRKKGGHFLLVVAMFGLGTVAMGFVPATWMAFAILFVLGIGNGFVSIVIVTQLQLQTSKELLGRVMSLLMFASVGLVPVSEAISGGVLRIGAVPLFVAGGILMVVTALLSTRNRDIRGREF